MRTLVDGIEAVLPEGTIHDGLKGLKKDNRGDSIDQLMIGAEGTLGVITAARLKLFPAVHSRAVAWLGLASPQARSIRSAHLKRKPAGSRGSKSCPGIAGSWSCHISREPERRSSDKHPWHVLVEATADGENAENPAGLLARLLAPLIERGLVEDATISASEAQAEAFWRIRDSLSEAERAAFGPATQHDISVPMDAMPAFMIDAAAKVEAAFPGTSASGFGHLGDGNIHFHVRAGERGGTDWLLREGPEVTRLVHDLVTAAGGSISAEHGIGVMKKDELERLSPERVRTLRAIKGGLDPKGMINSGKLIQAGLTTSG